MQCFFLWEVLKNFNSSPPNQIFGFGVVVVVVNYSNRAYVYTCILANITRLRDVYELGWLDQQNHCCMYIYRIHGLISATG